MTIPDRRTVTAGLLALPTLAVAGPRMTSIVDCGAKADGTTLNTAAIQTAIDRVAARGGGTVLIPAGTFISGALFLKPGVNLHLAQGAVLRCSTDMANFPPRRTRIEGHFEEHFNPGLINAKGCDGLRITGAGTLDGAGRPLWDLFWKLRRSAPDPHQFRNVGVARARLAVVERSRGVTIEGVTFKDSQFWNLHLYACDGVTVRKARFEVPDDYVQAPSTDGIDLDSCRNVLIEDCWFSVTDDCIAAKGSKGPRAAEDEDSPPVEHVRVRGCTFRRGNGILTLGSEATLVRDVVVERCRAIGAVKVAALKLRGDTPQHYENIHFRDITLAAEGGTLLAIQPWSQYADLGGLAPPQSIVRGISLEGIRGRFGDFGAIRPNPGQTTFADILLRDIDVRLARPALDNEAGGAVRFDNVVVNGQRVG